MRKILLIGLLLVSVIGWGQRFPYPNSAHLTVGGEGGEMITDGSFASGSTYWGTTGGWTIGGGSGTFDDVTSGYISQTDGDMVSSIQPLTDYTLTFDISGTSGGGLYGRVCNAAATDCWTSLAEYSNGAISIPFTTGADVGDGGIAFNGDTAGDSGGSITNVSLTAD